MAKVRKSKKNRPAGPYLDAALICEGFVQEKDSAVSPIRLVNRLTIHQEAPHLGEVLGLPLFDEPVAR